MRSSARNQFLLLFIHFFLIFTTNSYTQKKWDGGGGDNLWSTAANWSDDILPVSQDDVVFDNTYLNGSYNVQLPNAAVTINSISVAPSLPESISVVLPATNLMIPGFIVNGSGGIAIKNGGVFINSSGGSPGTAIFIGDSIKIDNGGKFIQNASNSHAAYINKLSRSPGTELGIFEFDVPGTASYTISLSGRTYGSLRLSSLAAGGAKAYLSNGTSPASVRGDFTILSGVRYTLDFTGDLLLAGSFFNFGQFNLASAANTNKFKIQKNIICSGTVTESSSGNPIIELNGTTSQQLSVTGQIQNNITFQLNNPAGCSLQTPVSLPYKLALINGVISTTSLLLLTLQPGCTIQADTTSNLSFIDGPLQKLGLLNAPFFLFPVGKGNVQRWVSLRNATGNFMIEFFKSSAYSQSSQTGIGIDHVSHIEYWSIEATTGSFANVELSFNNVNSGGVTDLQTLRAAHLVGGIWENNGNTATTGSAGGSGSVTGIVVNTFGPASPYFTLAGSESSQNPLPAEHIYFSIIQKQYQLILNWEIHSELTVLFSEIEFSDDGFSFTKRKHIASSSKTFQYAEPVQNGKTGKYFYRIHIVYTSGKEAFSKTISIQPESRPVQLLAMSAIAMEGLYVLRISQKKESKMTLFIVNDLGQITRKTPLSLPPGTLSITLQLNSLPAGYYQVFGVSSSGKTNLLRFFKP